jgi:hypothetical protein
VQGRSRARIGVLLLVIVALLSVLLRLQSLRARPLWFDELFTFWAARLPLRGLLDALRFDSGPPGFYLLEQPFAPRGPRTTATRGCAVVSRGAGLSGACGRFRRELRVFFRALVSGSTS